MCKIIAENTGKAQENWNKSIQMLHWDFSA